MTDRKLALLCITILVGTVFAVVAVYGLTDRGTKTVHVAVRDGLVPQPQFNTVAEYGPPYSMRVVCKYRGGPGKLDPKGPPKPGDTLVRRCVVTSTVKG